MIGYSNTNTWLNLDTDFENENENCTISIPKVNSCCRRKSSARGPRFKVSSQGLFLYHCSLGDLKRVEGYDENCLHLNCVSPKKDRGRLPPKQNQVENVNSENWRTNYEVNDKEEQVRGLSEVALSVIFFLLSIVFTSAHNFRVTGRFVRYNGSGATVFFSEGREQTVKWMASGV